MVFTIQQRVACTLICLFALVLPIELYAQGSTLFAPVRVASRASGANCIEFPEELVNGNFIQAICGASQLTANRSAQFQNVSYIVAGTNINAQNFTGTTTFSAAVTMAASIVVSGTHNNGSAVAPWNDIVSTNNYSEIYKIAYPGSTFGTTWTMKTVSGGGGASIEFLDSGGANFITFDGGNNRMETEGIIPKTNAVYPLGLTGTRYTDGFFSGVVNASGGLTTGTYYIDSVGTTNVGQLTFGASSALLQGATTRISTIGAATFHSVFATGSGGVCPGCVTASTDVLANDHLRLNSSSSVLKRTVGFTTTTLIDASNNAFFNNLTVTGTCTGCGGGGGGGLPVTDITDLVYNDVDNTKILRFDVGAISTMTTRVASFPDNDFIVEGINISQTITGTKTFAASVAVSGLHDLASAANPWNQAFAHTSYAEAFILGDPGSVFSNNWLILPSASGQFMNFVNPSAAYVEMALDSVSHLMFTRSFSPLVNNAYDFGNGGLRYKDAYFAGTVYTDKVVVGDTAVVVGAATFHSTTLFNGVVTHAASIQVSGVHNNGTAAAPWNDSLTRNQYAEIYKIAYPGTAFGTSWTMQTVLGSGGGQIEFLDSGGANFLTLDGSNNRMVTEGIIPKTHNTFDIGLTGTRYKDAYFQGTVFSTGGITNGTYGFNNTGTASFGQLTFAAGSAFLQGATTRINSSGDGRFTAVTALGGNVEASGDVLAQDHLRLGSSSSVLKRTVGFTTTTLIDASNNASFNDLGVAGTFRMGGTTVVDNSRNGTFVNLTMSGAFSGFTTMSGSVGGGNFFLRTFGGAPGCGTTPNGWVGYDTANHRLYVCDANVNYYAQFAP